MLGRDPSEYTSKETKIGKDGTQGTWNDVCLGSFFFCLFQCFEELV